MLCRLNSVLRRVEVYRKVHISRSVTFMEEAKKLTHSKSLDEVTVRVAFGLAEKDKDNALKLLAKDLNLNFNAREQYYLSLLSDLT